MTSSVWDFAARAINGALGDVVTWKPGTPQELEVRAVFGNGFERVRSGEIRVASTRPELTVVLSELPEPPAQGDQVRVREQLFEVATPRPDVEAVSVTLTLKAV